MCKKGISFDDNIKLMINMAVCMVNGGGEFIGGITEKEKNILHHPPVTRNDHLMELLDPLKLVNRSNLGVSRIYRSFLKEGK